MRRGLAGPVVHFMESHIAATCVGSPSLLGPSQVRFQAVPRALATLLMSHRQRDERMTPRVILTPAAKEALLLRERDEYPVTGNCGSPYLDCFLWNIFVATKPATSAAAVNMKKPLFAAGSLHR